MMIQISVFRQKFALIISPLVNFAMREVFAPGTFGALFPVNSAEPDLWNRYTNPW